MWLQIFIFSSGMKKCIEVFVRWSTWYLHDHCSKLFFLSYSERVDHITGSKTKKCHDYRYCSFNFCHRYYLNIYALMIFLFARISLNDSIDLASILICTWSSIIHYHWNPKISFIECFKSILFFGSLLLDLRFRKEDEKVTVDDPLVRSISRFNPNSEKKEKD